MLLITFITTFPWETGNATFQLKAKQLINFFGVDKTKPAHSGLSCLRAHTSRALTQKPSAYLKANSRWIPM